MGTFSGSGSSYTNRDYFTWGNVSFGSKQTSTGQSVDVQTGDYLGVYEINTYIEAETTGGSGICYKSGDQFGTGTQTYTTTGYTTYEISLYATGDTGGGATYIPFPTSERRGLTGGLQRLSGGMQ
jgi:hypothetical protein